MPLGAHNRGTRETICVIADAVATNAKTFLVLDEADKIMNPTSNAWYGYILSEVYDLCDNRWPTGIRIGDDDDEQIDANALANLTEKLRKSVFILAIGTFQTWFDGAKNRRTIGFGDPAAGDDAIEEITSEIIAERLPRELGNRFNSDLVRLPDLKPDDYRRIAVDAELKLPKRMREPFRVEVARRIESAITNKKGVRFLQEAVVEVLKKLPEPEFDANEPMYLDDL